MEPGMRKNIAVNTLLPITNAESSTRSLPKTMDGNTLQPLEQAVARLSTLTDSVSCENANVKVMAAVCLSMMQQTLSPDSMWLAMRQAQRMAEEVGVSPAEAERVIQEITLVWELQRRRNPLSCLF
jgi:pantoate kinase